MIRILHTADWHIGVENYGRIDHKTGVHSRLRDFLVSLDSLVKDAIEKQVDLVLFCGDAFKNREPSETHQNALARRLKKLSDAGIKVFMLVGNHDLPNAAGKSNALDIYRTLQVPGITVGRHPRVYVIDTKSGPVQVAAIPYPSRSSWLSREGHSGKTLEQLEEEMAANVAGLARRLSAELEPDIPAVLCAHITVTGAVAGSEHCIMVGRDLAVPASALQQGGFDYVALGHIHRQQVLAENPPLVYSGSLDRIDFGEEKEKKGYVLVEVEKGRCSYNFYPLSTRPFVTVRVKIKGKDPTAEILERVEKSADQRAILRLIIECTAADYANINHRQVRRFIDRHYYYLASINRELTGEDGALRNPNLNEKLDPLAAFKEYLETAGVNGDKEELVQRAESLYRKLKERDIYG
ncbi:exonuclease SbcD [Desulfohalotomaculum tongense]|uniref:metallophosphoesterase family protein n=1 Tax=Desulforadius tongensis TaxID=1216062 RepID=UPI0019575F8C|nr:exonuclease SbcCD subunit D [Desulforadius tongensis]MBM7855291.1 exonuclease SbcD [Desulforadius tongensis]